MPDLRLVIITGLSGAGKTQAIRAFEDLGFFCVDNLPPALLARFAEMANSMTVGRVAVVMDVRGRAFFDSTMQALEDLEQAGQSYQILFLEATDDVLVRRFKESRRLHPLATAGRLLEGIRTERQRLEKLRGRAHLILDTSELSARDLRDAIQQVFAGEQPDEGLLVNVITFGFKHGLPRDADLVLDVRFLPNPFYVPSLREKTGNDPAVEEYVLQWPTAQRFLQLTHEWLKFLLPQYVSEGKKQLTLAIGCTGGKHRSVVIGNALADELRKLGHRTLVEHRDAERANPESEGG